MPLREADEQERKLFVGGLNKELTDEESLKNFFSKWGTIVDVAVMRDNDKISRGFGFILYENYSAVDAVMQAKKDGELFQLDDHQVEIKRALPKVPGSTAGSSRTGGMFRKIFVGGLSSTTTERDVSDYFDQFGHITEVELLRDRETNRLRGFAFVTFEDEDSADRCIQRRTHEINKKICEVKRAQARSKLEKSEEKWDRFERREDKGYTASQGLAPSSGMLDMATVNQLIQEAHLLGLKQGLAQAAASPANLLGGYGNAFGPAGAGVYGAGPSPLLQALMSQSGLGAAAAAASSSPNTGAAANVAANTNLAALLLQGGRVDPATLDAFGIKDGRSDRSATSSASMPPGTAAPYSTAYPPAGTYDSYYQQQSGSSYGAIKSDDPKRNFRPY